MHIRPAWRLSIRLRPSYYSQFCSFSPLHQPVVRRLGPNLVNFERELGKLLSDFPLISNPTPIQREKGGRDVSASTRIQYDTPDGRGNISEFDYRLMLRDEIHRVLEDVGDYAGEKRLGLRGTALQKVDIVRSWLYLLEPAFSGPGKGFPHGEKMGKDLMSRLKRGWITDGKRGVNMQLRYSLQATAVGSPDAVVDSQRSERSALAVDLRYPAQFYPKARAMKRVIHLHIGPTNSGKTYHALQRLMSAKSGVFGGPLRLLAHEVYNRIIAQGRSCHLVTGDERILSDDPACTLASSTVEMMPLEMVYDVAVIDEIQMMGDEERGWAWTNAVLGVPAAELHLCGEARSLNLVRAIATATGEEVVVHEYKRLSPLETGATSLEDDLTKVQPGDCVVAFSRKSIYNLANLISRNTPYKVAVIYGTLPPDTRAEQARLFNDPDSGYDIMVASNAIGMGLNLNIRRVVFAEVEKYNGREIKRLAVPEVKQIGGRAGRYRIAPSSKADTSNLDIEKPAQAPAASERQSVGIVTTLQPKHLEFVQAAMDREPTPLSRAGIKLPVHILEMHSAHFPAHTPLSYILNRAAEVARTGSMFRLIHQNEVDIADAIQDISPLSLENRLKICAAPVQVEYPQEREFFRNLVMCIAARSTADLLQALDPGLLSILDYKIKPSLKMLSGLETLHKCLTVYMWLSFRFSDVLVTGALASHTRTITEQRISGVLAALAEAGKIPSVPKPKLETEGWVDEESETHAEDEDEDLDDREQHEKENDSPRLQDILDDLESDATEQQDRLRDLISDEDDSRDPAEGDDSEKSKAA